MPKISLDNLERYHGHLKDWCDARFAERKVHENWHETGPSGAVSFYPVPNRPIDPVVNFAFTETLPEGTKGSDNPSTITGISEVKVGRCGKNLCKTSILYEEGVSGVFTLNTETGGIKILGSTGSSGGCLYFRFKPNSNNALADGALQRSKTYTLSFTGNGSTSSYPFLRLFVKATESSAWQNKVQLSCGGNGTYTIPSTTYACLLRIDLGYNESYNCECFAQVEEGSTATSFEPYSGTDYTVNLGNTYYGGSVDLSTGIMTVTWWGHVFDGTEVMNLAYIYEDVSMIATSLSGITPIPATTVTTTDNVAFCTHYPHLHDWGNHVGFAVHPNGIIRFFTPLSIASTVAELQAFFASQYANGTPVVLTYPVLTPTTVSLTSTQIYSLSQSDPYSPNTVYSDQQSVLVRYPKSPIVIGSELDDAILSLGGD